MRFATAEKPQAELVWPSAIGHRAGRARSTAWARVAPAERIGVDRNLIRDEKDASLSGFTEHGR